MKLGYRHLFFCALAVGALGILTAAELPDDFRLEPVVGGLTNPSDLAVAPDGNLLVTERTTGNLRMVRRGVLLPDPVCQVAVETTGEAGLLGVEVHPAFLQNRWIYLYYTAAAGQNKVTRFRLQGTSCSDPLDVLANLGAGPAFLRNGGGLAFGPDGTLFVATGDTGSSANGQDDLALEGKILRVEADGTIPADNPTSGSAVFAKGIRDGRGVAVEPGGQVFVVDGGDASDVTEDELNAVPSGGNLGWDIANGDSGGTFDDPLQSWTAMGSRGLGIYAAQAFPDLAADGKDSDFDRYGPDGFPGRRRVNDNSEGQCIGSANFEGSCTSDADCPDRPGENAFCYFEDEVAEYCPNGFAIADDDCDATDEPDESYVGNLFMVAEDGDQIVRAVTDPLDPTVLSAASTFLNSAALADCPTGWTAVATGGDGLLYAVATNGGGSAGALYRVVYDKTPGPREVSPPGSPFPLTLGRGPTLNEVLLSWEDLRDDAKQPRDDGVNPQLPEREYTVWVGDLGNFSSHAPAPGLGATPGTAVNDALRSETFDPGAGSKYILVSARADNLEGTLGDASSGAPRTGYAVTNLCDSIGYHSSAGGWALWTCGRDFTLRDEHGELHSFSEYGGHPIVLDLSAIWCGPCNSEADVIENLYQAYKDRGVKVLTVLFDEDVNGLDWTGRPSYSECRRWGNRAGAFLDHTFSCWVDSEPASGPQPAWDNYNAFNAVPTNAVLDSGMRVVYTDSGYSQTAIEAKLDALVGLTDSCLH